MDKLAIYSSMYLCRRAETVIAEYYFNNKVFSFVHFYIGQEAVAVGVTSNLTNEDRVFGNHRSHGHYLAKGGNLSAMYSEMLGKANGCCNGKGGSMHMLDRSVGFMGSTPILASASPIATGSALQQKMTGLNSITAVFIGDGAAEEGIFYESLNLASLMNLPILFVIENNLYSVNSAKTDRKSPNHSYEKICEGMDIHYSVADGNDVNNVYETANRVISDMKLTKKPAVIECITYRHMAHSAPIRDDKAGYRVVDTEDVRERQDSLQKLRAELVGAGKVVKIEEIEKQIDNQVALALENAVNSPEPEIVELTSWVFAK